jgi:hypothetical protein
VTVELFLVSRFFYGSGSGSSLEVRSTTIKNGKPSAYVSPTPCFILLRFSCPKNALPCPGGPHTCNYLQRTAVPTILLGMGSTKQSWVSLLFRFHLHYYSALSKHFLPKELSQIFALIPGAGHATVFEWSLHAQLCFDFRETWFNRTG